MASLSAAELQQYERAFRERQLEYRGSRRERYERRVEREAVVRRARAGRRDRVLDAGCGLGRITQRLLRGGAEVVALDFALGRLQFLRGQAVEAAIANRLRLAQADVTRLPLVAASFSLIICTQVLEHIPAAAARRELLATFRRLLRPDGRLVLTVYNHSRDWQRRQQAKEGRHETGIFYHCYTAEELRSELGDFDGVRVCGVLHLLPHTYRLWPRLGWLGRTCDHALEHWRGSAQHGHLLLAEARAA